MCLKKNHWTWLKSYYEVEKVYKNILYAITIIATGMHYPPLNSSIQNKKTDNPKLWKPLSRIWESFYCVIFYFLPSLRKPKEKRRRENYSGASNTCTELDPITSVTSERPSLPDLFGRVCKCMLSTVQWPAWASRFVVMQVPSEHRQFSFRLSLAIPKTAATFTPPPPSTLINHHPIKSIFFSRWSRSLS